MAKRSIEIEREYRQYTKMSPEFVHLTGESLKQQIGGLENKVEKVSAKIENLSAEIEELKKALLKLDNDEYKMIRELFFKEKTVREYAKVLGLPYATVQYKKKQVLKKLKNLMKF